MECDNMECMYNMYGKCCFCGSTFLISLNNKEECSVYDEDEYEEELINENRVYR